MGGKDVVNGEKRKTKESQEAKAPKIAKILPEEKTQLPTLVKEVSPVPEKSNPEETKSKLDETSMKSKRNSSKPTSDKSNSNTSDIKSNSKLDKSSSRSTSDKSSSTSISDTKSRITSDTKSSSRSTADTKSSSRSTSDTKSSRSSNKKSDIGSRMTQIAYFGNTTSSKSADTKSRSTSGSKSLRSTADTKSSLRSTSDLKPSSKSSKHSSSHDRHEDPPRRQPSEPIASSAFCSKCLAIGHLRVNCPKKDLENGRKPFSVFCNMEGDGLANISDDELDYDPATKPIHPASIDSRLTQLAYTGDVLSQAKFTHGRNIQSSWNPSMPVICNCCKLLGHTEDECPAKVDIEVCGICKLLGHVATECPMAFEKRLEEFT